MSDKLYFDCGHYTLECNKYGSFKYNGPYKGSNPLPEKPKEDVF